MTLCNKKNFRIKMEDDHEFEEEVYNPEDCVGDAEEIIGACKSN